MSNFEEHLKDARTHAGLSQPELAEIVGVDKSYISKLERGVESPPSRKVAVKLADALGMINRPLTLYVSTKAKAAIERFIFFLAAYVAGAEDVQAIKFVEVEDDKIGQAVTQGTPAQQLPSAAVIDGTVFQRMLTQLQKLTTQVAQLTAKLEEREQQKTTTLSDLSQDDSEEEGEIVQPLVEQILGDTQKVTGVIGTVGVVQVESPLEEILRKANNALGVLPRLEAHSGSITFTFQAEEDAFRHAPELKEHWVNSLSEAMDKGWDIHHLVRLNNDTDRMLILVDHIRRYLGHRGDYKVFYTKDRAVAALKEYLVVDAPSQIAQTRMAIEFSSKTQRYIDDGCIFRATDHAKDVERIFRVLRLWQDEEQFGFKRLFDFYQKWRGVDLDTAGDWDKVVTEVEVEAEGPLSLFMNGLPGNTLPHTQYVAQLAPLLKDEGSEVAKLLRNAIALREKRVAAFKKQVEKHLFRHIMPIGALAWYKTMGYSSPDSWAYLYQGEAATRPQRVEHLKAIFDRLENKNYQMGLLKSYFPGEEKMNKEVFWQVKEGHAVLLEHLSSGEETDVKITESSVVNAFDKKFDNFCKSPLVEMELPKVKAGLLALV